MIRPPTRFRVLGQLYRMRVVRSDDRPPEAPTAVGYTDHDQQYGWIADCLAPDASLDTYLHEVLHAILAVGSFRHLLANPHDGDEAFVAAFAPQLLSFMRENPRVVTYLTQRLPS